MLSKLTWTACRLISQNGGRLSRLLNSLAVIYSRSYKNLNYDMSTNGEYVLLDRLAKAGMKTVFDVGANKGDYSAACLRRFPQVKIHAFEIVPHTFKKLQACLGDDERVHLVNYGLSNEDSVLEINYNPDHDGSSSLVEGSAIHNATWSKIEVRVRPGQAYCSEAGIDRIDLLKIDVEGAEHLVLEGFEQLFQEERISCVQFEFGLVNIYSKFLLNEFWAFFEKYGFVLGPIMPSGVDFKPYNPRDEDFQGPPNFFAVHGKQSAIIDLVRLRR